MNNRSFIFLVIVSFCMLIFISCDTGNNPGNNPESSRVVTYKSSDASGNVYTLTVGEELDGRYVVKTGDSYKLKKDFSDGGNKISYGSVQSKDTDGIVLEPSNSPTTFYVELIGQECTEINGTITFLDDTTELMNFIRTNPDKLGSATKFQGFWSGPLEASETYTTRLIFAGTGMIQQYKVDDVWQNEGIFSPFTFTEGVDPNKGTITMLDSGDGTSVDIEYTLSGTNLEVKVWDPDGPMWISGTLTRRDTH